MKKEDFNIIDEKTFNKIQKEIDRERKSLEKEKQKLEANLEKESANPSKISFLQGKKDNKIEQINSDLNELSEKLAELDRRQDNLNQSRRENTKKILKLVGLVFAGLALLVAVMAIVGNTASKREAENTTITESTTIITETTTITTTELTTIDELENVELTPKNDAWSVEVGEADDYISYRIYPSLLEDEMDEYNFSASVENPEILKAEVEYTDGYDLHVVLTGLQPGKTTVTITGKDNKVTCKPLDVTVREQETEVTTKEDRLVEQEYVLNTSTMKIHYPGCSAISKMSSKNKKEVVGTLEEFEAQGYTPCGQCNPH